MIGLMSALGAGIGVGVDAPIIRTQVIYRGPSRPSATHFNIAPLIRVGIKGSFCRCHFLTGFSSSNTARGCEVVPKP